MPNRISAFSLAIIVLISIFALSIRLQIFLKRTDLVGDEFCQYNRTNIYPLFPFWQNTREFDDVTTFPGHYLFLFPFIRTFASDALFLRTPTFIMQVLLFIFLYYVSKSFFKTIWGYIIAFIIVCFNATLIVHSLELRPYSSLPTLALVSFYYADVCVRQKTELNLFQKSIILMLYIFMALFYAYGIFIILLPIFYQFLTRTPGLSNKNNFKFLITLITISCLIWAWYIAGFIWLRYVSAEPTPLLGFNTFKYIQNPFVNFLGFMKGIFGNMMGRKELYFLFGGFIAMLFIPKTEKIKQIYFFMLLIVFPPLLSCLSSLLSHYDYVQRHFCWAMPFFAILIAWQWDSFIYNVIQRFFVKRNIQ
jgi:hypothetical protein